jgi:hypothetical protein
VNLSGNVPFKDLTGPWCPDGPGAYGRLRARLTERRRGTSWWKRYRVRRIACLLRAEPSRGGPGQEPGDALR